MAGIRFLSCSAAAILLATMLPASAARKVDPATMPALGSVDSRFQSYNVEMIEVTGGRFWKPYGDSGASEPPKGNTPAGMDPAIYRYRGPIDLSNERLRRLAAALGPAYIRVSGTWANTVFFDDSDSPSPAQSPRGFDGVLTKAQWKGVVDFAHAVNARIITSFATSEGTRDASGTWTPAQAQSFVSYNERIGGDIAAAEFMNEPTYAEMGGAPKGYDAAAFARDVNVFLPFLRNTAPGVLFLGPGSVGEGGALKPWPRGLSRYPPRPSLSFRFPEHTISNVTEERKRNGKACRGRAALSHIERLVGEEHRLFEQGNLSDEGSMINFMKNFAIAGGFLVSFAHGPGAWSLDARRTSRRDGI